MSSCPRYGAGRPTVTIAACATTSSTAGGARKPRPRSRALPRRAHPRCGLPGRREDLSDRPSRARAGTRCRPRGASRIGGPGRNRAGRGRGRLRVGRRRRTALVATPPFRPRRVRRTGGRNRHLARLLTAARRRSSPRRSSPPNAAATRSTGRSSPEARRPRPCRRADCRALAGRAEPDRQGSRPDPGRCQLAVERAASRAAGRRSRRLLRLWCHRVDHRFSPLACRARGEAVYRLVERLGVEDLPMERSP